MYDISYIFGGSVYDLSYRGQIAGCVSDAFAVQGFYQPRLEVVPSSFTRMRRNLVKSDRSFTPVIWEIFTADHLESSAELCKSYVD